MVKMSLTFSMITERRNVWLGIHRPADANKHQFYFDNDNSIVTWTYWRPGNPKSGSKKRFAVADDRNGHGHKWITRDDTIQLFYLCELI